ncbi:pilus assembly protein PilM [Parashewanella tropica]|uniref:pilus assembly protein PilM n=1 Tax=Parashewanella tropica TaxID=2547970 RepID=UPI00105999B5|nr:pilus assembly protein PilM [Parashewanella tropica]
MFSNLWKRLTPQMVGIDIGAHEIKAVLLSKTTDGYKINSYAAVPVKKGAVSDHHILDEAAVIDALELVKRRLPKTVKIAAASVSGSAVLTKVIFMDANLSEEEMEAQIEIEADSLIPYPLDEVSIDFETLQTNPTDASKVNVLLSACRTENIDAKVDALNSVDLDAKVIDVEGYALGRAHELILGQLPDDAFDKSVMMVDMGANIMTFAVAKEGETIFTREQAFGGDQFTQSIQSFYGMSYDEAEKAKVTGELPRDYMYEVLSPFQAQLLQQIKKSIQVFCANTNIDNVDYIVLSGGTAKLEGMANLITNELGVHAVIANPLEGNVTASEKDEPVLKNHISKYMVACGLALRSYTPWRT